MGSTLVIGNRNYSSWSLRAWWVARRSGLVFDEIGLKLDTPEFRKQIATHSPSGRVPVLHDGGFVIWDSLAIAEYLADKFPGAALWPAKLDERAMARCLCAEMHSGFAALRNQLPMNCRARNRVVAQSQDTRRDIDRLAQLWAECRRSHARGGPWLFGQWSIADAFFAPVVLRFVTYGIDVPSPAGDWAQAVLDDPDICNWLDKAALETELIEADEAGLVSDCAT